MTNLEEFAKEEFDRVFTDPDEEMNLLMKRCVLDLITRFAEQGHSGFSAPYCIKLFTKSANWEPLTPLTGDDEEWRRISDLDDKDVKYQNIRCGRVFKINGVAYDIDARVFSEDGGETWYTNKYSKVPVEFPYTPTSKPERIILDYDWVKLEEEAKNAASKN